MTATEQFEHEQLPQRIRQLEEIERDYRQCQKLLYDAGEGTSLDKHARQVVLYVQPHNKQIIEAHTQASTFLGYLPEEFLAFTFDQLEMPGSQKELGTYIESGIEIQVYDGRYWHRDGYELTLQVHRWPITRNDQSLICYTLEEKSLHTQLWRELNRREDADHQFREKLKTLNEITLELGQLDSLESICLRGVELGIQKLGFDRLSLWFLDASKTRMTGSFGVDEQGRIRDERQQSWIFEKTFIEDFINGNQEIIITHDSAPLYNDASEIVEYGWHLSAPILDGNQFIGFISADNLIHKQILKSFQPELLRLYGATIGYLATLNQAREKELTLRLEQERTQMLETFVTDIGHEFKTSLAIINTSNYIVSKTQDENKRQQHTTVITAQVKILDRMLEEILDIVNLTSTPTLMVTSIALDQLVQGIVDSFEASMIEKQLEWQIKLESNAIIQADAQQLARAIREIVENAIQFTPTPGQIKISTYTHGPQVGMAVQDTGIGIPADEMEKVFDRFYRVDKARTMRSTGLGLAIAKLIVEAHQGEIKVESVPEQGSRFEILLPITG
ncbi:MAG: HAMP domain-containing histidine kinase [Anaerolineae bacterium]|nr:HAMP domain-containing histidine kinase [Anaerolineae bacterium]